MVPVENAVAAVPTGNVADSGHESIELDSQPSVAPADAIAERSVVEEDSTATITLHLQLPNSEVIDVNVSTDEMAQEIQHVLLGGESSCHRTCFSMQFEGKPIDGFTELRNVENLKNGSTINVVEEQYSLRDVRVHLRHVRGLCRSGDTSDAAFGRDFASLCYISSLKPDEDKKIDKNSEVLPPSYLLPQSQERPLEPLFPPQAKEHVNNVVRNIAVSSFNPPPGPRKMRGDVVYLFVDTMEGRRVHITANTCGFFVNSSTDAVFNPTPSHQFKGTYHSLVELLTSVSSIFKKSFPVLMKRRLERNGFENLPTPYQIYAWSVQNQDNTEDYLRSEDYTLPYKLGMEDIVPGQIRNWNEEIQATHELPRVTYQERLLRARAMFKVHTDFVAAAVRGAQHVVDGNVVPINPGDESCTHMYIWNNIFFSLGFDVRDHYKELGGDAASHVATRNDLHGVRAYQAIDSSKLFTVGMVNVDYKGYRITAQSIIPGILEREQEQSVVYGSIDFGKTIIGNEEYNKLLEKPAEILHIAPHTVKSGKDDDKEVELYSSFETKGMIGNDGLYYILDLLRTFPPDVNYLDIPEAAHLVKIEGYPRKFPHKLAVLRHELVDAFVEHRYMVYLRVAALRVNQIRNKNKAEALNENMDKLELAAAPEGALENAIEKEPEQFASNIDFTEDARTVIEASKQKDNISEATKKILAEAARIAGSTRDDDFEMRFNPDCFCDYVQHVDQETLEKQRKLIAEAAEFLLTHQLPRFIRDCIQQQLTPIDGAALAQALHARGINVRYIGRFARCLVDVGELVYLHRLALMELFCRSAKHIIRPYLQDVAPSSFGAAVAHFLNCAFGAEPSSSGTASPQGDNSEEHAKKSNKKNKKKSGQSNASAGSYFGGRKVNDAWNQLTAKDFWKKLRTECESYFGYSIAHESAEVFVDKHGISKTALLRRFCIMVGVQLVSKDFNLDTAKARQPFSDEDVHNMVPIVKHVDKKARDASDLFVAGQANMQQGQFRTSYEQVAEALNMMNNVYGSLHPDMAQCLRLLARITYLLGEPQEAFNHQQKALSTAERCLGLDHFQTITNYIELAHFAFAALKIPAALKILYRARYLLLLAFGEEHPLMSQIDANIGVILYVIHEHDVAYKYIENSKILHELFMGSSKNIKTAIIQQLLARVNAERGDFRQALQIERSAYDVYVQTFGKENERVKQCSENLMHYTREAVKFQKRINQANSKVNNQNVADLIPQPLPHPTVPAILEILNILNDIIFISVPKVSSENTESCSEVSSETEKSEENNDKDELD